MQIDPISDAGHPRWTGYETMKVQAIRRGYGYLFNSSLFSQFHATVNTLSSQFADGRRTRGTNSRWTRSRVMNTNVAFSTNKKTGFDDRRIKKKKDRMVES